MVDAALDIPKFTPMCPGLNYRFGELLEQHFGFVSDKKCDIVLQNKKEPYQECASPSVCSALQAADCGSSQAGHGWGKLPTVSQPGAAALQWKRVPRLLH